MNQGVLNSITGKLLFILGISAVIAAVVLGGYLYYFRAQLVNDRNETLGKTLQAQVDVQIKGKLDVLVTNASSVAANPRIIEAFEKNDYSIAAAELKKVIGKLDAAEFKGMRFHLTKADMTTLWRSYDEKRDDDISFRGMIKKIVAEKKALMGVEVGKHSVGLRAMSPVTDASGAMIGIVEMQMGVDGISRHMRQEKAFYLLLVDKGAIDEAEFKKKVSNVEIGGKYLTANAKWFDEATVSFAKHADFTQLLKDRTLLNDAYYFVISEAKDMNGKPYGLHLAGMPRSEYDTQIKPVFRLANNLLIAIAFMGMAAVLLMIVTLKRIVVHPVQSLSTFLLTLNNDLTKRFEWRSADEVGRVAESVNSFLASLQQVVSAVVADSNKVAAAATQLQGTAQNISHAAEAVVGQATSVATAGEEMAATSSDIARNCLQAVGDAQNASEAAVAGSGVVSSTIAGMEKIAERVRNSSKTVGALGERSDQIGAIVATIEDIADQTNLLALNAAIEAARAGEQGRGFAVVADEVRALAERTTRATREIGDMIKAIQVETKGAVQEMESGVVEVEQGTRDASRSGEALQEILSRINDVTMQINQIATAAEEQTATTGEIAKNIGMITSAAQDSSDAGHSSVVASQQLSKLADELQSQVRHFRV